MKYYMDTHDRAKGRSPASCGSIWRTCADGAGNLEGSE
jgi:hypothetical protein